MLAKSQANTLVEVHWQGLHELLDESRSDVVLHGDRGVAWGLEQKDWLSTSYSASQVIDLMKDLFTDLKDALPKFVAESPDFAGGIHDLANRTFISFAEFVKETNVQHMSGFSVFEEAFMRACTYEGRYTKECVKAVANIERGDEEAVSSMVEALAEGAKPYLMDSLSNADPALRDILSKLLDTQEELAEGLGLYWDEIGKKKDKKAIEYMYKSIRDAAKFWLPVNSQNTGVFTEIFYKVEERAVTSLTDTLKRLEQELFNVLVCKPEVGERERPSYVPTKCAAGQTAENGFCFQFRDCDCARVNDTHRSQCVGSTMLRLYCLQHKSQQACINQNGISCVWRGPSSNAGLLERSLEKKGSSPKRQPAPVPEPNEPEQNRQYIYLNAAPQASCHQYHHIIKGKCYKECPSEWKPMAHSRKRCERDCPLSNPLRGSAGAVKDVCARTASALSKASTMQMVKGFELLQNAFQLGVNIFNAISGKKQKNELKIDDGAVINLDLLKNTLESVVAFAKSFEFPRCRYSR